ncbi:adenylate/guanylate cyclase domain-containing protein [Phaeobacter sp. HF9A]|uniref:adenylate/guanylate cyclase domain-containing protein n=1 Tax=Phaeobacter sp. HF9A TaxID=2721561 RepID=UPI001430195F|nr:adenylate/guanylate cyclase domain-containing protein [Phaeobacter sp. HF9A]NIZ13234.1 adenylate/guanylate cyclase domain-containing protein [Phaeobacter sp. HF9A]
MMSCTSELNSWLVQQGLREQDRESLLRALCEQLVNRGVPLLRMQLAQRALHPEFGGIGFTWTRADGMASQYFGHLQTGPQDEWYNSPFYAMLANCDAELFADLTGAEVTRFPVFPELHAMGARAYFAQWQPLGKMTREDYDLDHIGGEGVVASWCFDCPPEEAARHCETIRGCFETLVVVLSAASNREMGRALLKVYLGRDAGERVLSGEIQRGSLQLIDAVICLFDLRGFTKLSEQLPGEALVEMLNDYFGHVVEVIQSHGGNILKFMGDGVMAMFNLGTLEEDAQAALRAVAELAQRMEVLNASRVQDAKPLADYSLALHAGEILYGNIGAPSRLDFTVIGPAVNLTARIADLHRTVDRAIILSEEVRNAAGRDREDLISVGRYMLRGVAEPVELFTLYTPQAVGAVDTSMTVDP